MAIKANHNWLSSNENKELFQDKQDYFEKETNLKIKNAYEKRSFCSGFAYEMVIFEAEGNIYPIDDNYKIYIRNADWEEYKYGRDQIPRRRL